MGWTLLPALLVWSKRRARLRFPAQGYELEIWLHHPDMVHLAEVNCQPLGLELRLRAKVPLMARHRELLSRQMVRFRRLAELKRMPSYRAACGRSRRLPYRRVGKRSPRQSLSAERACLSQVDRQRATSLSRHSHTVSKVAEAPTTHRMSHSYSDSWNSMNSYPKTLSSCSEHLALWGAASFTVPSRSGRKRLADRAGEAMADPKLLASLDLMRRMPPSRMESSLEGAPESNSLLLTCHPGSAFLTTACVCLSLSLLVFRRAGRSCS